MATFSKDNEDLVSKCEVIKDTDKDYTLMKIPYANNKPIMEEIFDELARQKTHCYLYIRGIHAPVKGDRVSHWLEDRPF